jgi:uncharacterized delta-60 repeat protein
MIRLLFFTCLYMTACMLSAQPGSLDPAFGTGGILSTSLGSGDDVAQAMSIQPDGKIILAGYTTVGSTTHFALMRYLSDGTPDPMFGNAGKVVTAFGIGEDQINAIALQPDGKIVVAGYSSVNQNFDFALARYLPNGALDNSFSSDGKLTTEIGGLFDKAYAVAIQPDGRILAAGNQGKNTESDFAVVRYHPDGSLDTGFGAGGIELVHLGPSYDEVRGMALQPDGKIILAGFSKNATDNDFAVVRLDSTGMPDGSFGNAGIVTTPIGTSDDYGRAVALQPDGKIIVAGYAALSVSKYDFALARYKPNGALDLAFNATGIVTTGPGSTYDECLALALQPDGKMVAAGYSYHGNSPDFALVRYLPDGSPDATFGSNSVVTTPIGTGSDQALAVGIGPDGKIVAAGRTNNGTSLDFAAARYVSGLPVATTEIVEGTFKLYPNPVTDRIQVEYTLNQESVLAADLYNTEGQLVENLFPASVHSSGPHKESFQLGGNILPGCYVLRLKAGSTCWRQVVIKF